MPTSQESPKKGDITEDDSKDKPRLTQAQWWRAEELGRKPHEILDNLVKQIEDDQQGRYLAYREYERLFGATVSSTNDDSLHFIANQQLIQNELQATVETLWAQVFKNKIVPGVSVSEADWDEWNRAKGLQRWLEGAFDESGVYSEVVPEAGACTLVHGTGLARVGFKLCSDYDKDSDDSKSEYAEVTSWPVNPRFFAVDRMEAKHGKPRSCYFKDHVDRFVLYDTYSSDKDGFYGSVDDRMKGIMDASSNDDVELGTQNTTKCDMLTVREAFHLPSGPKAKDGRHVIWVKGCTLLDEPYTWDCLPVAVMRFGVKFEGFYGESAVKRLAPTQKLLDKLCSKIDESQDVMGVPRIIVRNGIGLKTQHIDDIPGAILEVDDINGIRDWNAQCASQEMYSDRDSAGQKMRALLGVSEFEGQGALPNQTREFSAPAMERWIEQGQARHAMFHDQYENFIKQLAKLYTLQAEELQDAGYRVIAKSPAEGVSTSIDSIDFEEVCIDRKRMKLFVQPMNQLPQTFSGKIDAIIKMRSEGNLPLDDRTAFRMLEIPDLNRTRDFQVSSEEIIFKNLTHMTKTGTYVAPMPFDDLDTIVKMTTDYINWYRVREDADNAVVGLLAQYIDDAVLLKKGLGSADPNAPPAMSTAAALSGNPGAPVMPMGATPMGPMGPAGPMPMGPQGMPPGMPPQGMPPMAGPPGAMPPGQM
jgi:hypothetical protein